MSYSITELVEMPAIQRLMDSFCGLTGIAAAIVDPQGRVVCESRRPPACADLHRDSPAPPWRRCESDAHLASGPADQGRAAAFQCRDGLTSVAAPVLVQGQCLANLFCGHFLLASADPAVSSATAREHGMEEAHSRSVIEQATIVTDERLEDILAFLTGLADVVGAMGLARARQLQFGQRAPGRAALGDLCEASPVAMALNRFSGEYVDANERFCHILGVARADVIGKTPLELGLIDSKTHGFMLEAIRTAGCLDGYEFMDHGAGDQHTHYLAYSKAVELCGEHLIITVIEEVSARQRGEERHRQLEAQLRQAQKMEAVGRLAGGIAHDLNNLLTPILGYAELAQMKLRPEETAHLDVREIQEAARRARDLTHQLLAFSRKQPIELKLVNLSDLVARLERILRRTIREDIRLTTELAPNLGLVRGDGALLQQVLLNLVLNANDAMPMGGTLTIVTEEVTRTAADVAGSPESPPGPYVRMTVTDTGCGMDEEVLRRLFEPFFTTKPEGKGTGLGLATSYGIVKQHGGEIRVESAPGRGSQVAVYLPLAARAVGAPEASEEARVVTGKETILIVDDAATIRGLVQQLLRVSGYASLAAANSEEALRAAREHPGPIQLLITDVIMPGMNGRELYTALRAIRPTLRVLYISGHTDDVIAPHGVLETGTHFLAKPFTVAALNRKIREALGGAA